MKKYNELTIGDWIDFAYPRVYALGIIVFFAYMVLSFIMLGFGEKGKTLPVNAGVYAVSNISQTIKETTAQEKDGNDWVSLVVKPIVMSPTNRIIFQFGFNLVAWVLLFMVVPLAYRKITRFKFFNLELSCL